MSEFTFKEFQASYPDDGACLDRIMKEQFGGLKISCPGCGADSTFSRITKRRAYACQWCGHHIYPCAGTIFEKSRTPLTTWFFAMYLMTSTRHGVAAKEIERQTGVTYKTAWRICHELRKLMAAADSHTPLSGHVEVDETYIGGKQSIESRQRDGDNKTPVMGMVEREDGRIRAGVIPNASGITLRKIITENIAPGTTISTDEYHAYKDLGRTGLYQHGAVKHRYKEYVDGIHHVNTLEGHWSILKRSIKGTHVHVSPKHLWKYVSEFSYRRNMRHSHWLMFDHLLVSVSLPRLQES
ncbi:MAG: IS1595 family transposase [Patescibacteria group bacterium]|nr:IS1595 family transposase [Patescibacteria group bacterium]